VVNGSGETANISVHTPLTQTFNIQRTFVTNNAMTGKTLVNSTRCDVTTPPAACYGPPQGPTYGPAAGGGAEIILMTVRVFAASAPNTPGTELPCTNCTGSPPQPPAGSDFQFALPGRSSVLAMEPPKSYIVMTMMSRSLLLAPSDGTSSASPPFSDFSLGGVGMTGTKGTGVKGCVASGTGAGGVPICTAQATVTPYRTLTAVSIVNVGAVTVSFETSVSPGGPLVNAPTNGNDPPTTTLLSTSTSTLPPQPGPAPL
jgi:hypothetical protein